MVVLADLWPTVGPGSFRICHICFLVGWHERFLNQVSVSLCLVLFMYISRFLQLLFSFVCCHLVAVRFLICLLPVLPSEQFAEKTGFLCQSGDWLERSSPKCVSSWDVKFYYNLTGGFVWKIKHINLNIFS